MVVIHLKKKEGGGTMVEISKAEALRIIKSLSDQMLNGSPNIGRAEFQTNCGYFSIAVFEELK